MKQPVDYPECDIQTGRHTGTCVLCVGTAAPVEGPVPTAIQNVWNDAYDEDDDPARCVACDLPIDDGDHGTSVCDDCSGLRGCVDDICHGMGYCMHVKDAWRA